MTIYSSDFTTFERFEYQLRSSPSDEQVVNDYVTIQGYIRDASRFFSRTVNRTFVPYTFTHEIEYNPENFDHTGRFLWLPDDCLSISSIVNTDGSTIASSLYRLRDQYRSPNYQIEINPNARLNTFSNDNFISRYEVAGIWGYNQNYSDAWLDSTTLDSGINASVTDIDLVGITDFERLHYIKIGDEMMQITGAIPTGSTPYTVTVKRGVNGTTATSHDADDTVSIWQVTDDARLAVTRLAVGLYRTRHNAGNQLRFADGAVLVEGDDKSVTKIARNLIRLPRIRGI